MFRSLSLLALALVFLASGSVAAQGAESPVELGIELVPVTTELRVHFGAPADEGALVGRVTVDSPAAAAGVTVGDVLVRVGAEVIRAEADLERAVRAHRADEALALVVVRGGKRVALAVLLTSPESTGEASSGETTGRKKSVLQRGKDNLNQTGREIKKSLDGL